MFDVSSLPIAALWIGVGVFFSLVEWLAAPGLGLLAAGIGALLVGGLVQFGVIADASFIIQIAVWVGTTLLLGWGLRRRIARGDEEALSAEGVVGGTAVVTGGDLIRGQTGHAVWSGLTLPAEIDPIADAVRLTDGQSVEITHLRSGMLYLRPHGARRPEESL